MPISNFCDKSSVINWALRYHLTSLNTGMFPSAQGLALLAAVTTLTGCAAGDALLNHRELEVETHMSETVFLDPIPPNLKTIFVTARNTSDHPELDVKGPLSTALIARGYTLVNDPKAAHYLLRLNVLQAGKVDADDRSALLSAKYGEPLLGGSIGLAAGSAIGGTGAGIGVGLAAAAGTVAANHFYKDVLYATVLDIQLSERPLSGAKVKTNTVTGAGQFNGSDEISVTNKKKGATHTTVVGETATRNARVVTQNIDEEKDFKQYQIREVAYAEKVNLKFEEANPLLITKLTSTLSNLFE